MIELRWLMKKGDIENWPQKTLQFRVFETVFDEFGGRKTWSKWKDVSTEIEDEADN